MKRCRVWRAANSASACVLSLAIALGCDGDGTVYIGHQLQPSNDAAPVQPADATPRTSASPTDSGIDGCGVDKEPGLQTLRVTSGREQRTAQVSVPPNYDSSRSYPLVIVLHARNGTGLGVRELLGLESVAPIGWAIFVYPDALVRTFGVDDLAAGWQNGPIPSDYDGTQDLQFIRDLVVEMDRRFCVQSGATFATGAGWGGDFSAVLGCFASDLFLAVAPVAANAPYFLPRDPEDEPDCNGTVNAWVFHGKGDQYFPLSFGVNQLDFWVSSNECDPEGTPLLLPNLRPDDECQEFECSSRGVRSCWYSADDGHDVPTPYYADSVIEFFRSFL